MFGIKKVNKSSILFYLFCFLFSTFITSCAETTKEQKEELTTVESTESSAQHFELNKEGSYTRLTIQEPFLGGDFNENYLLYPRNEEEPSTLATHKIAVPVQKVAIHSTTHLGFLAEFNQINSITAASNLSLYYDTAFNQRIEKGGIQSIGNRSLDMEALIESDVDVVFSFVIDAAGMKEVEKLRSLGQKVILISEYMENTPLNKAEWIKVFAAFFGEKTQVDADSTFNAIKKQYEEIRNTIGLSSYIPSVMIGFPWKGTWYVSGGDSYQAQLIRDAGASYPWSNVHSAASIPLNLEKIYEKSLNSDVWINPGSKQSYDEIVAENENFKSFKAFQNKRVYTNYKRSNEFGANDYWESGVVHPEKILQDLSLIFSKKDVQEEQLYYYQMLQ